MDIFVRSPLLAILPGLLFLGAYSWSGRRSALLAAIAWLLYALYERGMQQRWLCTGECNIRVDLFLVYAVLAGISLAAIVAVARAAQDRAKR